MKHKKAKKRLQRRIAQWEEMLNNVTNKDAFIKAYKKPGSLKK